MPLLVIAGVPILTPPGVTADLSPLKLFLFTVMPPRSRHRSSLEPLIPSGRASHRNRWLSVPPVASLGWGRGWRGGG